MIFVGFINVVYAHHGKCKDSDRSDVERAIVDSAKSARRVESAQDCQTRPKVEEGEDYKEELSEALYKIPRVHLHHVVPATRIGVKNWDKHEGDEGEQNGDIEAHLATFLTF